MAKKKSKAKRAREQAEAQRASAPAASGSSRMPVVLGVVALLLVGAWFWTRGADGGAEPHERPEAEHGHEAADEAPLPPIDPRLLDPSHLTETAPDTFAVELDTTAGDIVIDVHRAWSPNGADRFYNLVRAGYYTDVSFFRVIDGFMAQCGISGRPEINRAWQRATIADDPVVEHNTRGMVTFATGGPGTRTTQFFISFGDNSRLDADGFSPFGRVRDMAPVEALDDRYGEGAPMGRGPEQGRIQSEGNRYLRAEFPELDYIESARILP